MQVRLIRTTDGQLYAMKSLSKRQIAEKNQLRDVLAERHIMLLIKHPFTVQLRYSFQNEWKLYFVMDYYCGGSLYSQLLRCVKFSEDTAKFYAAELLSALGHLHDNGIAYRDLKLENILIDDRGHIALTDFGLSKYDIDKTGGATTFCGTAEYIAPEMLEGRKYGKTVDWWSFGILL